jgi:hypothetical protein
VILFGVAVAWLGRMIAFKPAGAYRAAALVVLLGYPVQGLAESSAGMGSSVAYLLLIVFGLISVRERQAGSVTSHAEHRGGWEPPPRVEKDVQERS